MRERKGVSKMTEREDGERNCRMVRNEAWKEKEQMRREKKTNMAFRSVDMKYEKGEEERNEEFQEE